MSCYDVNRKQLRAATSAVGANMADMCYHYRGEFVADRAAIQQVSAAYPKIWFFRPM